MDEEAYREIISRILSRKTGAEDIAAVKIAVSKQYGLETIPKNSAILAAAPPEDRENLRRILLVKPTRTLSGVAPVAVMTSPYPCPHGKCLPCPGGPDHEFRSPQSYTGEEPAAKRAREHNYDPAAQVQARLAQFELLGHRVEKIELIVMGGTMTARPAPYQEWFVARCIGAMNSYPYITGDPGEGNADLATAEASNERGRVRCVAITFETRPDWCRAEHIDRLLSFGVTKVELGVQHLRDDILAMNRRGCTVADTVMANTLLRDSGLKVGFHVMPNMPGSDLASDRTMFKTLFSDPRFRPDFLKIYPTLVTPGSGIERLWKEGGYTPYSEEDLIDLVAYAKSAIPEYARLQRIQRDIPANLIIAGSKHSNFRQLAQERLRRSGRNCRCIRCREIGRLPSGREGEIKVLRYDSCGGKEYFISAVSGHSLIGFARLRFPSSACRQELCGAAILRELHVYGSLVPVGKEAEKMEWQHRKFGRDLLRQSESVAQDAGFEKLAVMSGIGVRPYYRRQGYERLGPYMVRELV